VPSGVCAERRRVRCPATPGPPPTGGQIYCRIIQRKAGGQQARWAPASGNDSGFASKDDLNEAASGLNSRLDELSGSMKNAGGVQDRQQAFGQGRQGGPQATGTQRPGTPNPLLADFAAQRQSQQMYAAGLHESLANSYASLRQRGANFAAHTPGTVIQTGTGNGMSPGQAENSMAGALGGSPMRPNSGIGQSASSFDSTRFMGSQS
jgi:hypothetical protein